tara:strand:- start:94 stop:342 length:249 start_codon:yes stop_codon:yes gene_type:complete
LYVPDPDDGILQGVRLLQHEYSFFTYVLSVVKGTSGNTRRQQAVAHTSAILVDAIHDNFVALTRASFHFVCALPNQRALVVN